MAPKMIIAQANKPINGLRINNAHNMSNTNIDSLMNDVMVNLSFIGIVFKC